jgi:hypothetical protein
LTTAQSASYSIFLNFEFDELSGFRKILNFKNLASDDGVYNLSTDLNYFNFSFGPTGAFTAGTFEQVVLTRDGATGLVIGFVNGVEQFNFTDSTSDAVFNAAKSRSGKRSAAYAPGPKSARLWETASTPPARQPQVPCQGFPRLSSYP